MFGTHTGLYASEMILGAASFGTRNGYGAATEDALQILKAYADAGGNFIDTSDKYQLGESEEIIGAFVKGQRTDFIICSKYTQSSSAAPKTSNFGNHRKSMRQAVEASLKRLQTDYIDIYMPHYDDGVTPWEEIARGLEDLVSSGKILYSGLTNFPAWKASAIGAAITLTAIQIEYNLLQRTGDREFLPMASQFGLGVMMYSPLAGGLLTGKYRKGETGRLVKDANSAPSEDIRTKNILDYLTILAEEHQATSGQLAFAWVLSKGAFPLVGARKLSHLEDSLMASQIQLTPEQILKLDDLSKVSLGYPHELLVKVRG
ncbi:aldo/keto reductase [Pedobacter panaciterrae]|uniref:aldo/keto reductase n=1 Tax=Pedobacter panaciterrae TaxID=363849 RepID=UPI001FEC061C|nr:aldo/keto reductase [Pedobacter panaciterrae]